jgi:hypothetical protein
MEEFSPVPGKATRWSRTDILKGKILEGSFSESKVTVSGYNGPAWNAAAAAVYMCHWQCRGAGRGGRRRRTRPGRKRRRILLTETLDPARGFVFFSQQKALL